MEKEREKGCGAGFLVQFMFCGVRAVMTERRLASAPWISGGGVGRRAVAQEFARIEVDGRSAKHRTSQGQS